MPGGLCAESVPPPRVEAFFDFLQFKYGELWESGLAKKPYLQWTMRLQCDPPWRVAYVRQKGDDLCMLDSSGTRASKTDLGFCTAENHDESAAYRANLHIKGEKWSPSPKAVWIGVQGKVSVGVSCSVRESEKVTLSLKNGSKVPVVLKEAAGGKDVEVVVTVEDCRFSRWKKRDGIQCVVRVESPVPCGIKELEFFAEDGQPGDVIKFYEAFNGIYGRYYWLQNIWMHMKEGERFKMAVRYADDVKEVMVPVSFKVGMGGIVPSEQESQEKEERK